MTSPPTNWLLDSASTIRFCSKVEFISVCSDPIGPFIVRTDVRAKSGQVRSGEHSECAQPLRRNVKALSRFWVVGQACNSFLGRQDDRKRQSSHQDETEGPTRVQIDPTSRHEFKTQIAID